MSMVAFIARLRVHPEKTVEFEALQQKLAALTYANEPGTYVYDMLRSQSDPTVYVVVATFKDEAAFQYHQTTPFHDELVPPILACLSADMELEILDCLTRR